MTRHAVVRLVSTAFSEGSGSADDAAGRPIKNAERPIQKRVHRHIATCARPCSAAAVVPIFALAPCSSSARPSATPRRSAATGSSRRGAWTATPARPPPTTRRTRRRRRPTGTSARRGPSATSCGRRRPAAIAASQVGASQRVRIGRRSAASLQARSPRGAPVAARQRLPVGRGHVPCAAREGRLEVLSGRARGCPWHEFTCARAAENGHLEVLQWLRANGCPWNDETCLGGARRPPRGAAVGARPGLPVGRGHVRHRGGAWPTRGAAGCAPTATGGTRTMLQGARHGHLEALQWAPHPAARGTGRRARGPPRVAPRCCSGCAPTAARGTAARPRAAWGGHLAVLGGPAPTAARGDWGERAFTRRGPPRRAMAARPRLPVHVGQPRARVALLTARATRNGRTGLAKIKNKFPPRARAVFVVFVYCRRPLRRRAEDGGPQLRQLRPEVRDLGLRLHPRVRGAVELLDAGDGAAIHV